MAAIEVEANTKISKNLIGRSRPMRGDYVPGDAVFNWRAGRGVRQSQGHWMGPARVIGVEGSNLWVSHGATAIKCAKEQLRKEKWTEDQQVETQKHRAECGVQQQANIAVRDAEEAATIFKCREHARVQGDWRRTPTTSGKMERRAFGRTRHGEESRPKWRGLGVVQKVLGLCAVPLGAETDEPLQARTDGHERVWEDVKNESSYSKKEGCQTEARKGGHLKEREEESPGRNAKG